MSNKVKTHLNNNNNKIIKEKRNLQLKIKAMHILIR